MPELTAYQIFDLRSVKEHCADLRARLVVIGAIAYQICFPGSSRHTGDVDFAVALDLDEFAKLEQRLLKDDWTRAGNVEHRWRSKRGTLLDLIPAGPKLRAQRKLVWPKSRMTMSLLGFDHVFTASRPVEVAPGLVLEVIPPVVLMLLKVVAYMDDPNRRTKDLPDIRELLLNYEATNKERLFSQPVIDANLEDFSLVPAFLLGVDLRKLCNREEIALVTKFLRAMEEKQPLWAAFVRSRGLGDTPEDDAHAQLGAFRRGFELK